MRKSVAGVEPHETRDETNERKKQNIYFHEKILGGRRRLLPPSVIEFYATRISGPKQNRALINRNSTFAEIALWQRRGVANN